MHDSKRCLSPTYTPFELNAFDTTGPRKVFAVNYQRQQKRRMSNSQEIIDFQWI